MAIGPFRRVLVAWDGSADSVTALRTATSIVGDHSGHVVALCVAATAPRREAEMDLQQELPAEVRHARDVFEATRVSIAKTSPVRVDLHTARGRHIAELVCDYAVEHGFDLLVVGRHGDGGLMHPKLGHIADAAVRCSKIPVLLVSAG
jgi:nucleotide-binding universal stress UspA family protein